MKDGTPAWSVVIVVFNKQHDVLAICRGFNPRNPALPGGDSELDDNTPAQTAARELLEETAVTALELRCFDQWEGERGQPVFAFLVPRWTGIRLRTSYEGKPRWMPPEALLVKTALFREEAQRMFEKLGSSAKEAP